MRKAGLMLAVVFAALGGVERALAQAERGLPTTI